MAEFEVKINRMKSVAGQEKRLAEKLISAGNRVSDCRSGINSSIGSQYGSVKKSLESLEQQLCQASNQVSSMAVALSEIYGAYNAAELAVYGHEMKHAKVADAAGYGGMVWEVLGSASPLGKMAELIIKAIGGDLTVDKAAFDILKMLGDSADAVIGAVDPSGPGWWFKASDQLKKAETGASLKTASNAVKWAGNILTLAENFYSNYEEFQDDGGFGNLRFWGETALETGIDIGMTAGLTAAIAAGAAVAGVAAPVWAVAGAAGLIVFGIDQVTEAITGKSLKETVSDAVMDGMEKVSNFASGVGNAVSSWWNQITTPWALSHT